MSRIDEALRRLTGSVSPEPRTPQSLDRFASEGEVSHKADDTRRQAKIEPRKVAPLVVAPPPVEARTAAATTSNLAIETVVRQRARVVEPSEPGIDDGRLVDVRQVADYAGFVVRSVRRHKMIAAATFVAVVLVAGLVGLLYPKTYHVEVKLLAQRNAVMQAISNPGRAVPWDADAPTRAASETVLRRDNLISLIGQTDLINEWDKRRPVITRFKDWVVSKATGYELTPEDKLDALVRRLENQMVVTAGPIGDGTVTIDLSWPNAEMAYRIVERARQAFLDARQAAETSAIYESIGILERYSSQLHEDVNKTLGELTRAQGRDRATPAVVDVPRAPSRPRRPPVAAAIDPVGSIPTAVDVPAANPEIARLAGQLREKQNQLDKLESGRTQALSDAQATLATLKGTYTANHPSVQNAQHKLDQLLADSPQIAALRAEVEQIETRLDAVSTADAERMEAEVAKQRPATTTARTAAAAERVPVGADEPAPAPIAPRASQVAEFANLRLRTELSQLQSILERTDGARIELAVSEAAFKYRYTVIKPAQVPREPLSPNLRLLAMVALLAAIGLSIAAAVTKDLVSNRIVEAWQVERQLGLPILGSVRLG